MLIIIKYLLLITLPFNKLINNITVVLKVITPE